MPRAGAKVPRLPAHGSPPCRLHTCALGVCADAKCRCVARKCRVALQRQPCIGKVQIAKQHGAIRQAIVDIRVDDQRAAEISRPEGFAHNFARGMNHDAVHLATQAAFADQEAPVHDDGDDGAARAADLHGRDLAGLDVQEGHFAIVEDLAAAGRLHAFRVRDPDVTGRDFVEAEVPLNELTSGTSETSQTAVFSETAAVAKPATS